MDKPSFGQENGIFGLFEANYCRVSSII